MSEILLHAFIYLLAAVIAVPLAKRLGLGSVLGYLIAGIVIGPVFGLVGAETQEIQHFAEFGVVMMLFLVGLELEPKMLWRMRNRLLGLGGLQVLLSTLLIAAIALALQVDWRSSVAIGLIFALSSTAIVLQTLNEKGLIGSEGGRAGFSVLLFQDIAVIPMLALIPLLAIPELVQLASAQSEAGGHHAGLSLVAHLPAWAHALVVLVSVAVVVLGGHFLSRPLFRFIAESRLREIFTASALMLVIGIALLMTLVDLSPALGTFLAGVVLANSEFRHELESNIEPFKGLLLGLFFITVGAGIDFGILANDALSILGLTLGLILLKAAVLFGLARLFKLDSNNGLLFTLSLAQAGEFGFVLLGFSQQVSVIPPELARTLSLVVALSMLLTPLLFIVYERLSQRQTREPEREADTVEEIGTVVIAGIGRFGQIVNRLLVASGIKTVVLDHDSNTLEMMRRVDIQSYFGDASRPEILHAAGIEHASLIIIAIDDRERSVELAEHVKRHYPGVKVYARAFDVRHLYLLKQAGVDYAIRELFDSSLSLGKAVLKELGLHPFKVERMARSFRQHDEEGLIQLYELWNEEPDLSRNKAFIARAKEHRGSLRQTLESDRQDLHDRSERGWTPPPQLNNEDIPETCQAAIKTNPPDTPR